MSSIKRWLKAFEMWDETKTRGCVQKPRTLRAIKSHATLGPGPTQVHLSFCKLVLTVQIETIAQIFNTHLSTKES